MWTGGAGSKPGPDYNFRVGVIKPLMLRDTGFKPVSPTTQPPCPYVYRLPYSIHVRLWPTYMYMSPMSSLCPLTTYYVIQILSIEAQLPFSEGIGVRHCSQLLATYIFRICVLSVASHWITGTYTLHVFFESLNRKKKVLGRNDWVVIF